MTKIKTNGQWSAMGTLYPAPFQRETVAAFVSTRNHQTTIWALDRLQEIALDPPQLALPDAALSLAESHTLAVSILRLGYHTKALQLKYRLQSLWHQMRKIYHQQKSQRKAG